MTPEQENNLIIVEKPWEDPTHMTIALSIFLTTLITACFSIFLVHTYSLPASKGDLAVSSLLFAGLFTFVFTRKKKIFSILLLTLLPATIILLIVGDIFHLQQGMYSFLYAIEKGMYRQLFVHKPATQLVFGRAALPFFIASVNAIIAMLNSYVIVRRKHVIISALSVAPYLILTLLIAYNPPSIILACLTIYCIVIMLIYHNRRLASRKESEQFLLIITAPVVIIALLVGVAFPKKLNYTKLARKGIHEVRHLIMNHTSPTTDFHKFAIEALRQAEYGNNHDVYDSNSPVLISFTEEGGETNLREVGQLAIEKFPVGSFVLKYNPEYDDTYPSRPRFVYLRNGTMDVYADNTWTASDESTYVEYTKYNFSGSIDKGDYLNPYRTREFEAPISSFLIKLDVDPVGYVPYYTDFFLADETHTPYHDLMNVELGTHYDGGNLLEAKGGILFPFSTYPVERGDMFSDAYLADYVNGTCLTVPDKTREAVLNSGMLPQWYLDILDGNSEMTEEQKVKAITKFVSTLHPYDENTPYPPADQDFVAWFMTESDTGFCVHYATTAVILLRMAGIPARYVTGYVSETAEMNWESTIYTTDAHSWFEFYHETYGWVLGDSTPDNGLSASFYDINGIEKAYEVDDPRNVDFVVEDYAYREYDPETENAPQTPEEASKKEILEIKTVLEKVLNISLIVVVSITGLLILIRVAYFIYWKVKFSEKDMNMRARNYYHYFDMVCKAYRGTPSERTLELAQIARFSDHTLTDEEMDELIKTGEESIKKYHDYLPASKRIKGNILKINSL